MFSSVLQEGNQIGSVLSARQVFATAWVSGYGVGELYAQLLGTGRTSGKHANLWVQIKEGESILAWILSVTGWYIRVAGTSSVASVI